MLYIDIKTSYPKAFKEFETRYKVSLKGDKLYRKNGKELIFYWDYYIEFFENYGIMISEKEVNDEFAVYELVYNEEIISFHESYIHLNKSELINDIIIKAFEILEEKLSQNS